MAKNSIDVYGASGKTNLLNFEPENLHLVTDKTHPLYDERVHLPIEEGMVLNIAELGVLEPIIVWKDPETGLTCVVVGRQRVKHTLEANKLRLKEGKDPLLVPGVVKRGSANQMAKYMVSENEIRRPDTPLGRAKKCQTRSTAGSMRTTLRCCLAAAFRPFEQRSPSSMLLRPSGKRWRLAQSPLPRRDSLVRSHLKSSGKKWQKSSWRQLVPKATKKPVGNVRSSVMQSLA